VLDARTEQSLAQFTQQLCQLLGDDLVAVALYGSAAGTNFVPGSSDFNTAIVVQEMRFEILQKLQSRMVDWHQIGFAVPLVIDREFLQRSRDVFPMEFYDIQEQHRLLWGEDVFHALIIDTRYLRFLAEHEARSRLLRLQALYFERARDPERLRQILLDSLKTFLTIMRHLIRLQGKSGPQNYAEVLTQFEQYFQLSFPRMRQLIAIRLGTAEWPNESIIDFFRDYLADVQRLVKLIDRLPPKD